MKLDFDIETKGSNLDFDISDTKVVHAGGGGGVSEQRVVQIVEQKTADLQPKTDERLETESKEVVGAINELKSKTENIDFEETQSDYDQNDETAKDYIKNRPFYERDIEYPSKTYEFDGVLDGKEKINFFDELYFVKISDDKPSIKELLNAQYVYYDIGLYKTTTVESIDDFEEEYGYIQAIEAFVVLDGNKAAETINPAISDGLWFVVQVVNGKLTHYPKRLITNAYTETEIKKIEEKFLPESLVKDIGAEIDESTNVLTVELKDKNGNVIASTEVVVPVSDLTEYVKKDEHASESYYGVMRTYHNKFASGLTFIQDMLAVYAAEKSVIDAKSNTTCPIVPFNMGYAWKVAATTNTETFTDEEKASACETIGAVGKNDKAGNGVLGLIAASNSFGTQVTSSGVLMCRALSLEEYKKFTTAAFISKGTLENVLAELRAEIEELKNK